MEGNYVMATFVHKSGTRQTHKVYLNKMTEGMSKDEMSRIIKTEMNNSGLIDKLEAVIIK